MADIYVQPKQWVNAYTAAGLPVGTAMLLQNKGDPVLLQEAAEQPLAVSDDGFYLAAGRSVEVDAGSPGVWIKAPFQISRLFVQEVLS